MKIKAFIYIILAGILWGSQTVFVYFLKPYGFSSFQLTAVRAVVSFAFMAVYALIKDKSAFKIRFKDLLVCLGVGVCLFVTAAAYYVAMDMTTTATAVVIMYMSPVYVMIFSVLFFKEKISSVKLAALILVIGGSILVSGAVGGELSFNFVGLAFAFLSGLTLAGYNIFTKLGSQNGCKTLSTTLYGFMFMSVFALVFGDPVGTVKLASAAPLITLPLLIALGIVTCVTPYFLYNLAVDHIPVGTAAALAVIDPMAATVCSVFIGETLTVYPIIGIVLVLSAVVLLGLAEGRHHKKEITNG